MFRKVIALFFKNFFFNLLKRINAVTLANIDYTEVVTIKKVKNETEDCWKIKS